MLAPTEEWRDFQSFQPGEHEEVRSIQRPQTPRKPKVRDPRKGLSASADDGRLVRSSSQKKIEKPSAKARCLLQLRRGEVLRDPSKKRMKT